MRAVIPSVRYADYLAVVLPVWIRFLPARVLAVVTTPEDRDTQAVAASLDVPVCVTDAWTRNGAVFNKALALDEAFGFAPGYRPAPSRGETCLALDADVVPFGRFPDRATLADDTLYGCARYESLTPEMLEAHRSGELPREDLQLIAPRLRGEKRPQLTPHTEQAVRDCGRQALGYFQLFRYRPGVGFGSSRTAGKYDLDFRAHFTSRRGLTECYVLHLGEQSRANWRGRVLPPWKEA